MRDGVILRIPAPSAEEATRLAQALDPAACALGVESLAGPGPALVGSLARLTDVMVDVRIWAGAGQTARAVGSLAAFGATWVTVAAPSGEESVAAAVEAARPREAGVVSAMVASDLDRSLSLSGPNPSAGKVVSRLAREAERGGAAGVLCTMEHLGVVAEVAPALERFVTASSVEQAAEARRRRASWVVLDLGLDGLPFDEARAIADGALGRVADITGGG